VRNPLEGQSRSHDARQGAPRAEKTQKRSAAPRTAKPVPPELDEMNVGSKIVGPLTPIPVRRKKSEAIRAKLLDTAEMLFAKFGYAGISIRDVTSHADMRLANVSYYFGSKQNLYFEVLRRRAEPLASERLRRYDAVIAGPLEGDARLAALIDAFVDPAIEFSKSEDRGWKHYFSLIGQVTFSQLYPTELAQYYNEPARKLIQALGQLYPSAPAQFVQMAAMLMIGPFIFVTAETRRIETFSEAAYSSSDLDFLSPNLKQFIFAGVRSILSGESWPGAAAKTSSPKRRSDASDRLDSRKARSRKA